MTGTDRLRLAPGPGTTRLDFLAAGRRPWLLLVLLCLALYLPGIGALPPVDRDEARYVQATRQMLETGDFLDIRFQGAARNKKPVGIYWLQSAAVAAFSHADSPAIWPYRLVSVAAATASVLAMFAYGARLFDRSTALLAASLLATSLDLVFEAHVATTDAVLLFTAIVAQSSLGAAYLGARRGETPGRAVALTFWLAEAAAVLLKGPVVPLLGVATVLALWVPRRRWRWLLALRPAWGFPLAAAIVAPWLVLIEMNTGGAFLREAVGHDLIGKLTGAQEAHGAPPLSYLALLPVTFWPGSLFLGLTIPWVWKTWRLAATRFLCAWLIPYWIVLELVPTKLPHYVLPLYPALALLTARAIVAREEEGFTVPHAALRILPPVLWVAVTLALFGGFAAVAIRYAGDEASRTLALAGVAAAIVLVWRGGPIRASTEPLAAAGAVLLTAILASVIGFGGVLPGAVRLWPSREAARLVAEQGEPRPVAVAGYAEPSLVFLLGTDTPLVSGADAAAALKSGHAAAALVESRQDAAFKAAATAAGIALHSTGAVGGFDYSNGRNVILQLYLPAR